VPATLELSVPPLKKQPTDPDPVPEADAALSTTSVSSDRNSVLSASKSCGLSSR